MKKVSLTWGAVFSVVVASSLLACPRARVDATTDGGGALAPDVLDALAPTGATDDAGPEERGQLVADEDVGPLLARLSEDPGRFPSDNYVTNETTLLDVAPELRDPRRRDRAYVGVGPDQSFSYLAMLDPRVAYIVDIRRGNTLEHMFFRACFEAGETRSGFLSALLSRRPRAVDAATVDDIGDLLTAFDDKKPDPALRAESLSRTRALMGRLRFVRRDGDDEELGRIVDAFATRGLSIAYAMQGSHRRYPTLAENFAARDVTGERATFLATEESYRRVRGLVLGNRVLPVVGDFGSPRALRAVAADMRERGVLLGAFYTSNVEQYLFDARKHGTFVDNVRAMPRDELSLIVRVWFDQGKRHPAARPGHRTTQLTMPANVFVERADRAPFRSYWQVVTAP
ncbi:MAG: hypothetical protein KC657_10965 [Myxococcales bacterium]|nr:hypothetical protein [Myxococcales bacterium]